MRTPIVLGVVALLAPNGIAQNPLVTRARVTLQPKPVPIDRITIENLRDSAMIAWSLGFTARSGAQPAGLRSTDFAGDDGPWTTGTGPIAPHERRVIQVEGAADALPLTPVLTAVAFADGYHEGSARALAAWRESRQARVEELVYWLDVMNEMPRDSAAKARRYLADRALDRAGRFKPDVTGFRTRLWSLSREPRPFQALLELVDMASGQAQRTLQALRRVMAIPLQERPVTAAALSVQHTTSTTFVVAVENRARVPLEAFAYEFTDADASHGGLSADFCAGDADVRRGGGRIRPGEIREYPFTREVKPGAAPPAIRLRYALFADQSFEGSAADRDTLLAARGKRCGG